MSNLDWHVTEAVILVESSYDNGARAQRYRLWDASHTIPESADVAEIQIDGYWEEMHFNTAWGTQFGGSGTWLKQKASQHFSAPTGNHTYLVRFKANAQAASSRGTG